jgi:hypothetical protein
LLAFVWFTVAELEQDLLEKHGEDYGKKSISSSDFPETWLDLEPAGPISIKINFIGIIRARTSRVCSILDFLG